MSVTSNGKISVSEKKSLEKLLQTKRDNVLFAINNEVFNKNEEVQHESIRNELGITQTSGELETLIEQKEKEIEGACQEDYEQIDQEFAERNTLEIQRIEEEKETLTEKYRREIQALKEKQDREVRELNSQVIDLKSGVKTEKEAKYKEIEQTKYPEMFAEVTALKAKHADTSKKEIEAGELFRKRKADWQKHSARFINIINERHLDSLTRLTLTEDRRVAEQQVNWLPSSVQIATMAQEPGGLLKLIEMLSNPNCLSMFQKALPAPVQEPVAPEPKEINRVSVILDGKEVICTPDNGNGAH